MNNIASPSVLRQLWRYLWSKEHGVRARVVLALTFLFLSKVAILGVPFVFKMILDALGQGNNLLILPVSFIFLYTILRIISVAFQEGKDAVFAAVEHRAIQQVAYQVFVHLHDLSLRFHLDRRMGGLTRLIERGTRAIETLLRYTTFNILPTFVELIMLLGVLLYLYGVAVMLIVGTTIISYTSYTIMITHWRVQFFRRMNAEEDYSSVRCVDSLLNYETVKYFGNEELEIARYEEGLARYAQAAVRNKRSLAVLNIGQGLIISLGVMGLFFYVGDGIVHHHYTVTDFVLVTTYLFQLWVPLGMLGFAYREIKQALINIEEMLNLLTVPAEVKDASSSYPLQAHKGEVCFDNVSFSYNPDREILRHVSFKVPAGKRVAIVGPSGSGKSTIARLLYRFYDVSGGDIYIDDQPIRQVTQKSLRQVIGVVPQDTVLFNDSIFYNIAYGRPSATREEVMVAAQMAHIHDFILSLPEGYDTAVGERGLKLSGGEKQRVAIARMILKNPLIYVFDEATSALDSRTEKDIQKSILEVSRDHTTLIIAHRLATIVDCDEILVLQRGAIIERGTHKALLKLEGVYADMWARQSQQQDTL